MWLFDISEARKHGDDIWQKGGHGLTDSKEYRMNVNIVLLDYWSFL